jgi:hypothetical protein
VPDARRARPRLYGLLAALVLGASAVLATWVATRRSPEVATVVSNLEPTRITSEAGVVDTNAGDAHVRLDPHTSLVVVGDDARGFVVMLEHGRARFVVPPRGSRPRFVVQAGEVRVEVVGTELVVSRHEAHVDVGVTHGVVRIVQAGRSTTVAAGQRWSSTETASVSESVSASASASDSESASESASDSESTSASESAAESASASTSAQSLFERASALEATDPAAAAALYRRVSRARGPWAANALYAHGRLEAERGRHDRAATLAREYLRRFPRGSNAEDARALLDPPSNVTTEE